MARASKPVDLIKESSKLTKEEIDERKQAEKKLKGSNDKVYKPPKHLSKEEKKLYKFLVNELQPSGILNNLDITILETCVNAIYEMQKAKEHITEYGQVIIKDDGSMQRNPSTICYKDYVTIFNKCCMELGLSPSARSKLAILNINSKQEKENPLFKALRGDD